MLDDGGGNWGALALGCLPALGGLCAVSHGQGIAVGLDQGSRHSLDWTMLVLVRGPCPWGLHSGRVVKETESGPRDSLLLVPDGTRCGQQVQGSGEEQSKSKQSLSTQLVGSDSDSDGRLVYYERDERLESTKLECGLT